jgi:eukaryotic-like serine/threonine-protein kinase
MVALVSSRTFEPNALVPGTKYVTERRLGAGSMGVVYAVHDLHKGERRALKVLSPWVTGKPDLARRLVNEGHLLSKIRSPHLVRVYEVDQLDDGRPYFVMDLLEGETLRDMLARGPLPSARACGFVYQTLSALAHVHRADLVHRDVKPDNIFVRASDGACVLLDFGLVKVLTESGPFRAMYATTGEGIALGTLRYMPPEAGNGTRPDARADVYAAGVVLAELLAGGLPLNTLESSEYLAHLNRFGFPMPAGLHPELRRLIEWATTNDPDERLPSATRFAAELGWACLRAGIDLAGARPELPPPPPTRPPPARPLRVMNMMPAVLVGGLGWGAAAALAAGWWQSASAVERVSHEPRAALRAAAASPVPAAAVAPTTPPLAEPPAEPPRAKATPQPPAAPAVGSSELGDRSRAARIAALEATLRSGKGTYVDVQQLVELCEANSDKACSKRAYAYLNWMSSPR